MTHIMIIIDGMNDEINNGFSQYENMYHMQQNGAYGTFDVCPEDYHVDSLTCILTLLGVSAKDIPYGRSYFEALYKELPVENNDLILRCNLVRIEDQKLVSSCCQELKPKEFNELANLYDELSTERVHLHHMSTYKNILNIKDAKERIEHIKTFAPHENIGRKFEELFPIDDHLSDLIRTFIQRSIKTLNRGNQNGMYALLPWGESIYQELPLFFELHQLSSVSICATEIVKGLSMAMGMEVPYIASTTADIDTDLINKCNAVIDRIGQKDFILLHINGSDEASHRSDIKNKVNFISRIDQEVIGPLLEYIPNETNIMITSDHSTYIDSGEHHNDPQPFILYNKNKLPKGYIGSYNGIQAVELLCGY